MSSICLSGYISTKLFKSFEWMCWSNPVKSPKSEENMHVNFILLDVSLHTDTYSNTELHVIKTSHKIVE